MFLLPCIHLAGGLQLLIASASIFAPRKLHYRENLAKVSAIVREIFIVMNIFVVLTLLAFASLSFLFAPDLAGATPIGRFLSGFLAVFWGLRLTIQLFFYNTEIKRQNPKMDVAFTLAFIYLCSVFTLAASGLVP